MTSENEHNLLINKLFKTDQRVTYDRSFASVVLRIKFIQSSLIVSLFFPNFVVSEEFDRPLTKDRYTSIISVMKKDIIDFTENHFNLLQKFLEEIN